MYALDSGALACILQMLAEHPQIQQDLRKELLECPGEADYATLEAFPLLDAVIKETLRLVCTLTLIRTCSVSPMHALKLASASIRG